MSITLTSYTVYTGHVNITDNTYVFDDFDLSFEPQSLSLSNDYGYMDNEPVLFYVSDDMDYALLDDIIMDWYDYGMYCIDYDNTICIEENFEEHPIYFQYDDKFIFVTSSMFGKEIPTYENTEIEYNGNTYVWNSYVPPVVVSTPIAHAMSMVINGRSFTSNLIFETGKSYSDFVPGNRYTIKATYLENMNYAQSVGISELEISKRSTETNITGSSSVTVGESVTLLVLVVDKDDTPVTVGSVSIYDGSDIIQNNYTLTGNSTAITFTFNTVGTHQIRAIYTDSNGVYNSSNSNVLGITVNKRTSVITLSQNSVSTKMNSEVSVTGVLSLQDNSVLVGSNIQLKKGNTVIETVTTDSNGAFTVHYIPSSVSESNSVLTVYYAGTNSIEGYSVNVNLTVLPLNVSVITESSIVMYSNEVREIEALVLDENNTNVNEGTVTWTLTEL